MASHPLNYDPYPEVQPTGGPEAREQIHTDPDMFGAAIGRGLGDYLDAVLIRPLHFTEKQGRDHANAHGALPDAMACLDLLRWLKSKGHPIIPSIGVTAAA